MRYCPAMSDYAAAEDRYENHPDDWFRRVGNSGLFLPAISLGCWHNFGGPGTDARKNSDEALHENARRMLFAAFDHGCTHFDLANNYGPPPGSAEERVGRILSDDFAAYRDELIVSSKAGYRMGPGPYGEWGSRKALISSCEASLKRLKLEYVDIFYHHRPDPNTPLEETLFALDSIVRSGKALYVGVSNYGGAALAEALRICDANGWVRPIIDQPNYNLFDRWIERDLLGVCERSGVGTIVFSPLAQGMLTDKYLDGVPEDSRAKQPSEFLKEEQVTQPQKVEVVRRLNAVAQERGQSLAQLALVWTLREQPVIWDGRGNQRATRVTSALIGASRPEQVVDCCRALDAGPVTAQQAERIEAILGGA